VMGFFQKGNMNKPASLCSTSCCDSRNRHNKQGIKLEHKDTMNIKKRGYNKDTKNFHYLHVWGLERQLAGREEHSRGLTSSHHCSFDMLQFLRGISFVLVLLCCFLLLSTLLISFSCITWWNVH
jgi:hypothetical protein